MSILWAVRHGQANIAGPDYDILSPLGAVQARALGTFMAHPERRPDVVYSGPRLRQRDTARHLIAGLVDAGAPPPQEAPPLVALDEYPAEAIVRQSLPALKASHPELLAAFSTGAGGGLGSGAARVGGRCKGGKSPDEVARTVDVAEFGWKPGPFWAKSVPGLMAELR